MSYSLQPDKDLTILIPARAGSKRIPGKNTKLLGGKPLIQWTIDAAKAANAVRIIVSTDAPCWNEGFDVHNRKPEHATDDAPDILWVLDVLPMVQTPCVAICRPTSPFRTGSTIRRGYAQFMHSGCDSLRAVEKVTEHPGKMWTIERGCLQPVIDKYDVYDNDLPVPWHSMPTQQLPAVYKQNASLEIASVEMIRRTKTISGTRISPFFTEKLEGLDINTPEQWAEAERIAATLAG